MTERHSAGHSLAGLSDRPGLGPAPACHARPGAGLIPASHVTPVPAGPACRHARPLSRRRAALLAAATPLATSPRPANFRTNHGHVRTCILDAGDESAAADAEESALRSPPRDETAV